MKNEQSQKKEGKNHFRHEGVEGSRVHNGDCKRNSKRQHKKKAHTQTTDTDVGSSVQGKEGRIEGRKKHGGGGGGRVPSLSGLVNMESGPFVCGPTFARDVAFCSTITTRFCLLTIPWVDAPPPLLLVLVANSSQHLV